MPDSGLAHPPFLRVLDSNATLQSGAKLKFYDAGTSTPRTVYSDSGLSTSLGAVVYTDSAGFPVASEGSSTKVAIYTGTTAYKLVITDADNVTIAELDNLSGALDTSSFTSGGGSGITSVLSRTTDFNVGVTSNDDGVLYNCDPSGGTFTATLGSASTAGDGFTFGLKHAGTSTTNSVKFVTTSSQTIALNGVSTQSGTLLHPGQAAWFVSNGANWVVFLQSPADIATRTPIPVTDRLGSPPTNPAPGAFYIINNASPTGDWSSFDQHDLVESNGQGGWIQHAPPTDCGWLAYVKDENLLVQFRDSAWVDLDNITTPDEEPQEHAYFTHTVAANTAGGDSVASAWTDRTLNTDVVNTITGCSRSGSDITLPAGTYDVRFFSTHYDSGSAYKAQARFKSTTTSKEVQGCTPGPVTTGENQHIFGDGILTLTAEETFTLEYYSNAVEVTNGLGIPANLGSQPELYAWVKIIKLESPQGARGPGGYAETDTSIALVNGANSNIDTGTADFVEITGPTAAFSTTGFVAGTGGQLLTVYNTVAFDWTITNDATSTAANRILTLTGSDVTLTGVSAATFRYSDTSSRWILTGTQG